MLDEGLNQYWDVRMIDERHHVRHEDLQVTTTWLRRIGIAPRIDTGFRIRTQCRRSR